jgi:putative oxidoreductase
MSTSTTGFALPRLQKLFELWRPRVLSTLRIVACFTYMEHGTQKLFNLPHARFPMPVHLPPLFLAGGVIETFGGLLLLIGLFTRPVAFLLCGEMAVVYFMMHVPHGFWPLQNGGESPVLYCFIFLYLVFAGGGVWSIDHLLRWRHG